MISMRERSFRKHAKIENIISTIFSSLLALVIIAVNLDWQTRRDSRWATWVPTFARSEALKPLYSTAREKGNVELEVAYAREAVLKNPIRAQNLSMFGVAEANAGNQERASKILLESGARGWRDATSQSYILQLAMATGETSIAADRLKALWSIGLDGDQLERDTSLVVSSEPGRNEISKWVADEPGLAHNFLAWSAVNLQPNLMLPLIISSAKKGAKFDCNELAPVVNSALTKGLGDAAWSLWTASCGAAAIKFQNSLAFQEDGLDAASSPFAWQFKSRPGAHIKRRTAGSDQVIDYINSNFGGVVIASRFLRLAPGLHSAAIAGTLNSASGLILRIKCVYADGGEDIQIARLKLGRELQDFTIPETCTTQRADLIAGQGTGSEVRLMSQA